MDWPPSLAEWFRVLTPLGAVVAFAWGIVQFAATQRTQAETRRIEAAKPFLERQLRLYTEATQTTATLAAALPGADLAAARRRFWELHSGELALVEGTRVSEAMYNFGQALAHGGEGQVMHDLSLAVAKACRDSLAESWGVSLWRDPRAIEKQDA